MRAQIISFGLILFVALILAILGLTIKSEKEKLKEYWFWNKRRK